MSWESPEKPKNVNAPAETSRRRARGKPRRDVGSNRQEVVRAARRQPRQAPVPATQSPVGCYWFFFDFLALISVGLIIILLTGRHSFADSVILIFMLTFSLLLTGGAGVSLKNRLAHPSVLVAAPKKPSKKTALAITYDSLAGPKDESYKNFTLAFSRLTQAERVNLENPAKASEATFIFYGLPDFVTAPFNAPALAFGPTIYYFLPDRLVIGRAEAAPLVFDYCDITVSFEQKEVFELEGPPSDAEVVGESWLHATKSGEADRRYQYNPRRVVTSCGHIRLLGKERLDEYIRVSRPGLAEEVVIALQDLVALSQSIVSWPEAPVFEHPSLTEPDPLEVANIRRMLEAGNYSDALPQLTRLKERFPDNPELAELQRISNNAKQAGQDIRNESQN